ncbi:hypothetical protein MTR_1g035590 [Medicago truncatula]|uniref:Uncharacterized protein n=1 Tax=Medicago truncatula TaxID=3880 RepID=A0A072VGU2_MEDTR|nr:hypothetical protein MTR_1g035590 [Medicago truncatula]
MTLNLFDGSKLALKKRKQSSTNKRWNRSFNQRFSTHSDILAVKPFYKKRFLKLRFQEFHVFDRFRLSDQLRSSAYPINDFGVIHVVDLET